DIPGMRNAGSQGWAGVLNTHFWVDPKANLAGLLMTQSLPFVEPRFVDTYAKFERAAYRRVARGGTAIHASDKAEAVARWVAADRLAGDDRRLADLVRLS